MKYILFLFGFSLLLASCRKDTARTHYTVFGIDFLDDYVPNQGQAYDPVNYTAVMLDVMNADTTRILISYSRPERLRMGQSYKARDFFRQHCVFHVLSVSDLNPLFCCHLNDRLPSADVFFTAAGWRKHPYQVGDEFRY